MNPLIPIIALCIRLAVENQALRGAAAEGAAGNIVQNPLLGGGFRGSHCQATSSGFSSIESLVGKSIFRYFYNNLFE